MAEPSWSRDKRKTAERLRGRAGQEQRRRRLDNEPLCRICLEKGIVRAATVPDHIEPLALGGSDEDGNIRCLCEEHHREVTAEQFGHRIVRSVGADGWPKPSNPLKNG